jgi:prepilin-type N-terminal cleavage/methylation domain-containing protein
MNLRWHFGCTEGHLVNRAIRRSGGARRGYTVAEILVVVAIIGLISLVAVPQFATFYRGNKMRSAVRTFTTKLRSAQQLAITSNSAIEIRFKLNTNQYTIWRQSIDPTTYQPAWTQVGSNNTLEAAGAGGSAGTVYFQYTEFDAVNGWNVIDFNSNGTIDAPSNNHRPLLTIHTDDPVTKDTYTVTIALNGGIVVS